MNAIDNYRRAEIDDLVGKANPDKLMLALLEASCKFPHDFARADIDGFEASQEAALKRIADLYVYSRTVLHSVVGVYHEKMKERIDEILSQADEKLMGEFEKETENA